MDSFLERHGLPQVFQFHVFCCSQRRPEGHPRGSCAASGAGPLWERLAKLVEAKQMAAEVSVVATGCMGFCSAGPLMVVYPEGIWYQPTSPTDIDRIVEAHFEKREPVEDLVVVLKQAQ